MATKGNLGEVVTICERSWVQASPWRFSFRSEKGVGFIPKANVQVLHTAQLDVTAPQSSIYISNSFSQILDMSPCGAS
uniref:Uncharacterized protein n=1 Tax=Tanacetum cinerariifolium TaxID=118510 RepID=A0A6L2LSS0_TANCI|nr:hypothetical protein [Tanacetum cinerariifolium]